MNARAATLALLALLLGAPLAGALPGSMHDVEVRYAASEGPVGFALGALTVSGPSGGPLLALDVAEARFERVPEVLLVHHEPGNESVESFENVAVQVRSGGLLWAAPSGTILQGDLPRGGAFGVPNLAIPAPGGDGGSQGNRTGVILLADGGHLDAAPATDADAPLVPFDARVTLSVDGEPLPGWDDRPVNPEGTPNGGSEGIEWSLVLRGVYEANLRAGVTLVPVAEEGDAMRLTLRPARNFEITAVTDRLRTLSSMQEAGEGGFDAETLGQLGPAGALLNGALVLVRADATSGSSVEVAAAVGKEQEHLGQVTILRADELRLTYGPGEAVAIDGNATYSFMNNRFTTEAAVAQVAGFPMIAVGLWAVALLATAVSYVRVPRLREKSGFFTSLGIRTATTVLHLAILAAVFVYWDGQFAESFGTSFLQSVFDGVRDPITLAVTLGVQMSFWSLAAVAFALPVTLAIRMLLRMRGHGKSWKGLAKAAGLGSLAFFGPAHALFLFNLVLQYARLPTP